MLFRSHYEVLRERLVRRQGSQVSMSVARGSASLFSTLRSMSEMERNPEVSASTRDEALLIPAETQEESRGPPSNSKADLISLISSTCFRDSRLKLSRLGCLEYWKREARSEGAVRASLRL